jgi:hypothetical protein
VLTLVAAPRRRLGPVKARHAGRPRRSGLMRDFLHLAPGPLRSPAAAPAIPRCFRGSRPNPGHPESAMVCLAATPGVRWEDPYRQFAGTQM